jgi:hypothetical protein
MRPITVNGWLPWNPRTTECHSAGDGERFGMLRSLARMKKRSKNGDFGNLPARDTAGGSYRNAFSGTRRDHFRIGRDLSQTIYRCELAVLLVGRSAQCL